MGAEDSVVVTQMRARKGDSGGESPPHGEGSPAKWEHPVSLHESHKKRGSP